MCGIAGFIGFDDNISLARNNNCIQQHRGPDVQDTWQDEYIALSHQRLSIIDLDPRSNQPMVKEGLVIIFNGEIAGSSIVYINADYVMISGNFNGMVKAVPFNFPIRAVGTNINTT